MYQEEHGIDGLKLEDAIKKLKQRPYDHYKEANPEGMEPLKNEKLMKKQKMRKYIKKIKIQELKGDEEDSSDLEYLSNTKLPEDKKIQLVDAAPTLNQKDYHNENSQPRVTKQNVNTNNPFRIS